jgi:hypothetical protein
MQKEKRNTKKLGNQTLCVKQAQSATEICPLQPLVALVMGVSASEREEGVVRRQEVEEVANVAVLKFGVCRRTQAGIMIRTSPINRTRNKILYLK